MTLKLKWRLSDLMAGRGIDYKVLAEKLGKHPVSVNRLKNHMPEQINTSTLLELCRILDCNPGDLITLERPIMPRLAKKTQCPSCGEKYALEVVYGGPEVLPIGHTCKNCGWSTVKKD